MLKEFREFAVKGNMIDMAVGIIIGTAFNNVVNTIVKKVVMPPLSMLTNDVMFIILYFLDKVISDKYVNLTYQAVGDTKQLGNIPRCTI